MKFEERSFVDSKAYRPRPIIHFNSEDGIVLILTPWGSLEHTTEVQKIILDFLTSVKHDSEATSPFQILSNLSSYGNHLRTSLLLANDYIYKNINKEEYIVGFETFAGIFNNSEFVWTSCGQPHLLLSRNKKTILPLNLNLDHSLDLSEGKSLMPPLPNEMIGIQPYLEMNIQSIKPQAEDKLILLNRSWIPKNTIILDNNKRDFEGVSRSIIDKSDTPFWLGMLEF